MYTNRTTTSRGAGTLKSGIVGEDCDLLVSLNVTSATLIILGLAVGHGDVCVYDSHREEVCTLQFGVMNISIVQGGVLALRYDLIAAELAYRTHGPTVLALSGVQHP